MTAKDRFIGKARNIAWRYSYWRGPRMMSRFRQRWEIFRNPKATIRFGTGVMAGPGFHVHAPWGGTLIVGDEVEFRRNTRIDLGPDAVVTIGNKCRFTFDVVISCDTSITLEDGVTLAQDTYVADGNHRFRDLSQPVIDQGYNYRPITIGRGSLVHAKVTVVNDIGERAVIGANAVITKPIPPFTVAAGVPARVLDYYGPPGSEPEGWTPKASGNGSRVSDRLTEAAVVQPDNPA
jgi:acetyltransferase-like isoleucine patch superfamily enzyme